MNLFARLFGVGLYFSLLIIFCILISNNRFSTKKILFLYCLCLSVMGFFFKPNESADLYRINILVKYYSNLSINDFILLVKNSNSFVMLCFYRLIGMTNKYNLLPAITCFICYSNIFYVFNDYSEKNYISNKAKSIALLVIMCNSSYFECISGIRTMLAFSILIRCFYNEMYNNKKVISNLFFYILACSIHLISVVIIVVKFICNTFDIRKNEKNNNIIFKPLLIISFIILIFLGKNYINGAVDKAIYYIYNRNYTYIWENILTVLLFLLIIIIQSYIKKDNDKNIIRNKRISRAIQLLIIIFCFEHNTFFRLNNFNLFLNIPIILTSLDYLIKKNNKNYKYITFFSIIILIISCARGNLCSLKFWE